MILSLHIENYALIEELHLAPHHAFNVITGETGAGKSIILGALGLLLGNRADRKVLFNERRKCVVEAVIDVVEYPLQEIFEENDLDYEPIIIVRREILPTGKSRAFVNDTPISLEVLSQITSQLIDIHSQHDNLLLSTESYQRNVIDVFAQNQEMLAEYQAVFADFQQKDRAYQNLLAEKNQAQQELDYQQFLLDELQKAQLQENEQEELEEEFGILENAEEIKSKLAESLHKLQEDENSVLTHLRSICRDFEKMSEYASIYGELAERLENILAEIKDITNEVENLFERTEYEPERLEWVQKRLDEIERLQKKHRVQSVKELLQIQQDLQKKVERVLNFDEILENTAKARQEALQKAQKMAENLLEKRKSVVEALENELQKLLAELGMPNARLQIQVQPTADLHSAGMDKVTFLFSANKGFVPQEIKNVASGGEFSRLTLSIKYILAGKTAMPTLVFDEIDAGISGEIALRMALMMKEMAKCHQIIAITHLHQIAAKAAKHYVVFKEDTATRTISRIKELSYQERVREIAQMISGTKDSESALQSAKELLESR